MVGITAEGEMRGVRGWESDDGLERGLCFLKCFIMIILKFFDE